MNIQLIIAWHHRSAAASPGGSSRGCGGVDREAAAAEAASPVSLATAAAGASRAAAHAPASARCLGNTTNNTITVAVYH